MKFLHQLADWLGPAATPVILIWDGAPWHKAQSVQKAVADLGFTLKPIPGYSPDFNPIEGLWKWMRTEVTQHHCYASVRELFDACQAFIQRINADPSQHWRDSARSSPRDAQLCGYRNRTREDKRVKNHMEELRGGGGAGSGILRHC